MIFPTIIKISYSGLILPLRPIRLRINTRNINFLGHVLECITLRDITDAAGDSR